MKKHLYVIYKDDHTDTSHINDLTHANLISKVTLLDILSGYNSTRVEYEK